MGVGSVFDNPQEYMSSIAQSLALAEIGIYRYAMDGTVLYMDPTTRRMLELDGEIEVVGKNIEQLMKTYSSPGTLRLQTRNKGEVRGYISCFTTLKGNVKWAIHDSFLVRDPQSGQPAVQVVVREITKEKLLEEALQNSERRYRLLFNEMLDGFLVLEVIRDEFGKPVDGRVVEVNSALLNVWGIPEAEALGKTLLELFPDLDRRWFQIFVDVAATGESQRAERYSPKFKKYFEISVYTPQPEQVVVVLHNITDQKVAELALRRELGFHRLVTAISTDLVLIEPHELDAAIDRSLEAIGLFSDADRGYVFQFSEDGQHFSNTHEWCREGISPQIRNLQDLSSAQYCWFIDQLQKEKTIALHVRDLPPEASAEKEILEAQGILSLLNVPIVVGKQTIGFIGFDAVRQEREWDESTLSILRFAGEVIGNALFRKKAYLKLERSERLYRELVDSLGEGLFCVDSTLHITYTNRRMAEILNCAPQELLEQPVLRFFDETDSKEAFESFVKQGSERGHSFEVQLRNFQGVSIPALLSPSLAFDAEGNLHGGFVLVTDLTELKRLEARVAQAEKMEALGRLAGGVAHDLNNILCGLVGLPDLLLTRVTQDNPLRKSLETIKKAGERAAGVVDDLLALSRRSVARMEVVDLNEIISEYLNSPYLEQMKKSYPAVTVHCEMTRDTLCVRASGSHILKSVMNLVLNACEAMPQGGTVCVRTYRCLVNESGSEEGEVKPGDYVVLEVSDTGTGISEVDRVHIFEPFYTRKVMGRSGTGLGLTVVWNTVRDCGGYVTVETREGQGSKFRLYFPAVHGEAMPSSQKPPIDLPKGKGETVLVVDDMPEQRDIVSRMLEMTGYVVHAVESGEAAVEFLKKQPVHLLVLDMLLGDGIDGLDTYKKVLEVNPKQKAVVVSGFAETDRVREILTLGTTRYLKKPYTFSELAHAVRSALDS